MNTDYVDNAPITPEPVTAQERADLKAEREEEEYASMYEAVRNERQANGKPMSEIQVAAETMRRLRKKYTI